jgi:hypothetical protein
MQKGPTLIRDGERGQGRRGGLNMTHRDILQKRRWG